MINYNKTEYRESEKSEMEGIEINTILRRDKNGNIVEVNVPDDKEEEV